MLTQTRGKLHNTINWSEELIHLYLIGILIQLIMKSILRRFLWQLTLE